MDVRLASEEHFARIHRAALVLSGNPWDADDLTQETFLVLARQASQFEARSSLFTWLYGVLLNLERRQRRRTEVARRKLQVLRQLQEDEPPRQTGPAAAVETREWQNSLWSQVSQLPDGQRQALVLRFSEHLSYQQIAEVLGCPLGTVKSRIYNGLATLRSLLDAEHAGELLPPIADGGSRHAV